MARFIAVLVLAFLFIASPVQAKDLPMGATDNPNHEGYMGTGGNGYQKMDWNPVRTSCSPCEALVRSYNDMMQSLFDLRYQKHVLESDLAKAKDSEKMVRKAANSSGNRGVNSDEQTLVATSVAYQDKIENLQGIIKAMSTQIGQLEDTTKNMRSEITRCEKQCTSSEYKKIIEVKDTVSMGLPFAWRGPYPEGCEKCAKLAARLNELPALAYNAMGAVAKAKADKMVSEAEIANARGDFDVAATTSGKLDDEKLLESLDLKGKGVYEKIISEQEKRIEAANKIIDANEADLAELKRNFEQTLDLYNKCLPTCPKETGMVDPPKDDDTALVLGGSYAKDLKGCIIPEPQSYVIGANSQYGTGAALREKVGDTAKGAAMSALGSVLGGSGFGLGGGGHSDKGGGMQAIDPIGTESMGGGGQDGPDLDSNPLKGKPKMFEWSGYYIGANAGFTNDGLVVTENLKESPDGNSTFHTMYLENGKGQRLMPTKYYVIELYRDNKLTVWWTYDHWTDGVHDDHDEGSEAFAWRDSKTFKFPLAGDEGAKNSIWYQSGYDTAVKGVRQVGALFPVSPGDLTGCGLNLTTHLTRPDKDPVVTEPMVLHLFNDAPADAKFDALGKKVPVGMELFKF